MKLQNKKTGEIVDFAKGNFISSKDYGFVIYKDGGRGIEYNSLAEFNKEWEDYEEPKQSALRFMILTLTNFIENEPSDNVDLEDCKQMLEKLKAWERLKDKGFKFNCWDGYVSAGDFGSGDHFECCGFVNAHGKFDSCEDDYSKCKTDLDLLFDDDDDDDYMPTNAEINDLTDMGYGG